MVEENSAAEKSTVAPKRLQMMRNVAEGKVQRRPTEAGQVWEIAGSDARGEDKKALRWLDQNGLLEFGSFGGGSHQPIELSEEAVELLREQESRHRHSVKPEISEEEAR